MLVPKLRFKEFKNEWNEITLKKLLSFKNGINGDKNSYGYGIKYISVGDILNNTYITYDKIKGLIDINDKTLKENSVEYGDMVFQRSSETFNDIGQANVYLDKKQIATFGGFVIRGKKIGNYNPLFFNYLLKSPCNRKKVIVKGAGAQHYNISQEELEKIKVNFTGEKEQVKIANLFYSLDKKTELQKQKIEALKIYKRGLMKHLFNNSSNIYVTCLKNICTIRKGQQLNRENMSLSGNYYVLNGGSELSGYTNRFNVQENTISISEGGNSCGFVNFNFDKFWAGGHCYVLDNISQDINIFYLYHLLKYNQEKIMNLRVGSGLPNIQKKALENFELFIHIPQTQHYIYKILNALDAKINLEINKLKNLNLLKKSLLQQMFI